MDVLWFLKEKLNFIRWFYETASEPFETACRKIAYHEEPYEHYDPEDEAPFLNEYMQNKEALHLLGKSCLCLCQNAFKEYLDGFIRRSNDYGLLRGSHKSFPSGGGSWFERYKTFFLQEFVIDWEQAPVDLSLLEQVNYTRNDIQHSGTIYDMEHRQNNEHFVRFADSIFADELQKEMDNESDLTTEDGSSLRLPYSITITQKNLNTGIQAIEDFCSYVDGEWQKHPV